MAQGATPATARRHPGCQLDCQVDCQVDDHVDCHFTVLHIITRLRPRDGGVAIYFSPEAACLGQSASTIPPNATRMSFAYNSYSPLAVLSPVGTSMRFSFALRFREISPSAIPARLASRQLTMVL